MALLGLLWTRLDALTGRQGDKMAHEEPLLDNPPTQDVAAHVRDYSGFTKLLKWGAIVSFVIAMIVLMLISN